MSKRKFAFQICLTNLLFPNITSIKHRMERQKRTGHFHVNSKEAWNMFYDGVKNRLQSNRQFTQDIWQWHKSSIEAWKKSQGSIGPYNTPNTCRPEKDSQQKFTFHIYSAHVLFPNITSIKRQMQTRRVEVISTSTPKRGGTCFTMVWIIECRETDSLHKTCGKDTRLPSKQKKNLTRKHWAVEHAK